MSTVASEITRPAGGVRIAVVVAVLLSAMLEVLDSTIVNVALPHIKSAFGATTDQSTWILTSYIMAAVIVMPLTGFMARRVGRRRLILASITGFALFSALCGLSWSLESMVAFRIGQGMFGAFLIPLSQSILFDSFAKEKRGQAMAVFGLGVVVAPVLGPTIGAVLTEYYSWRMVFFVNMPLAIIALLMLAGELPRDKPEYVRIDWSGLVLLAIGIGALQLFLDQGESQGWLSSRLIQVAIVASVLGSALFIARTWQRVEPLVDLQLFADRNFAAASAVISGFAVAMFGSIALIPLFVQGLLEYPVIDAGYLFIPRGLAAGLSMIITGSLLVTRFDPRMLAAVGLILTAWSNFAFAGLNLNASFTQLAIPGLVGGLGMGLVFVPLSTLAFSAIDKTRQNDATGLYGVTRQLGSSVGIAIVGALLVHGIATETAVLSQHITPYSSAAKEYLQPLGLTLQSDAGAAVLAREIAQQAAMNAYSSVFGTLGWVAVAMLPVLLVMNRPRTPATAH